MVDLSLQLTFIVLFRALFDLMLLRNIAFCIAFYIVFSGLE